MTIITAGSLLTDSWNMVCAILKDQLTDTSSDSRAGSEFVVSAWPNRTDYPRSKWLNYPFVVLTNEVESANNLTLNLTKKEKVVVFHADVYNKSQAFADRMANQICEAMEISESGLEGSGLTMYRMESMSTSDTQDPSGATLHLKSVNWRYDYRAIR